ncbi:MAG TPA: hypothetical protein VGX21_07025 [Methylomirabilota bacterium]|nr:hypothetical protein [Methylomirabilota bacterium]
MPAAAARWDARVVLLGASNLTLGLPTILSLTQSRLGRGPKEILVAAGHGRSYGRWSRVFLRGLPGIIDCGLWGRLPATPDVPTYALVTDIGNDLAYGASPVELAGWVEACVDRLAGVGARIVVTGLPARTLARLTPWRYHLLKAVLFPGRRLSWRTLNQRVVDVNERLTTLAAGAGMPVLEPEPCWYAPDAIHIRRGQRPAAWRAILSGWDATSAEGRAEGPGPVRCRGLVAECRTVAGVTLRRAQPSGVLEGGTTVSLF